MPVIIDSNFGDAQHPFFATLSERERIAAERAAHQDIRPLEIAIVNLMANKADTESQLAACLGRSPLQINLTIVAPDDYVHDVRNGRQTTNTPAQHILDFYQSFSEIKNRTFDGLILTGFNAQQERVEKEEAWRDVQEILDWSSEKVTSSLFLCWGAKAALKHFHDIDSLKAEQKVYGVFQHALVSDTTGLLNGFPDQFPMPVSRWKSPRPDQIRKCPPLEIVAECAETGPNIVVESGTSSFGTTYPRRVYLLSHPEYPTGNLNTEYLRDCGLSPDTKIAPPKNYFTNNDPHALITNTWRHTGFIYANWVNRTYDATPYDLAEISEMNRSSLSMRCCR